MAVEVLVRITDGRLATVDQIDDERISRLKNGAVYKAVLTTTQERSLRQLRMYWAILGKVVENHEFYTRSEALHLWLKVRLGYVQRIEFHDGKELLTVDSASFPKMDHETFTKFLDQVLDILCAEVLPGTDRDALLSAAHGPQT